METFTDDIVVALASFLSPHDMLSLALTCKRFGAKHGTDKKQSATREESSREVRQRIETTSLVEIAARTVLHAKWTEEEKNALPRRGDESWIGIYQEFLKLFRMPLQFDKLIGYNINYDEYADKTKVSTILDNWSDVTAICSNIIRSGKHSVSFQVNDDDPSTNYGITCGIMRPTTKDITSLDRCFPVREDLSVFSLKDYESLHRNNIDCCLMNTWSGDGYIRYRWKKWEESELLAMNEEERLQAELQNKRIPFRWDGMEEISENSFKIGMVLDLDEGTLDVFKNGRRLGTIKTHLSGEYCWVVSLISSGSELSVSIGR